MYKYTSELRAHELGINGKKSNSSNETPNVMTVCVWSKVAIFTCSQYRQILANFCRYRYRYLEYRIPVFRYRYIPDWKHYLVPITLLGQYFSTLLRDRVQNIRNGYFLHTKRAKEKIVSFYGF
jgi:hypothetical protein